MKKTAILIMIITVLAKVLGFVREVSLSYFFGASNISDAYLISLTIPNVIFSFIGIAIATGFIPLYSEIKKKFTNEDALKFTNNIVNILVLISTMFTIVTLIYTKPIVKLFASGFVGTTLDLAIKYTQISIFGLYFSVVVYLFNAYLQVNDSFIIPTLVSFPMNIVIIASMYIASKGNDTLLPIGSVLGFIAQLMFIMPFAIKNGYKYKGVLQLKDKYILNLYNIALPAMLGVSVNQLNVLVDRTVASQVAEGGISALNYANRLNGFVFGIFVMSITTVFYPTISKMVAENNIDELKKALNNSISAINLLVIPATFGAMVFAQPIVDMLFARGAFDRNASIMTAQALFYYSIGMIAYGLREILSRTFYSLKDTKTPTVNATLSLILNIILNLILSKFMGIAGLALATSLSAIVCTGLLFINLRKKIGSYDFKSISISTVKITFSSILMGLTAKLVYSLLMDKINKNTNLILSIFVGSIIYFIIIPFMNIREVNETIEKLKIKILFKKG